MFVSSCGSPAAEDAQVQWCDTHAPELFLADEVQDQDDLNALIKNAAIARIARRLPAESEFLTNNFNDRFTNDLSRMRQLESYAEAADPGSRATALGSGISSS